MADNVALKSDASATVATLATDEISSAHYQRIKLIHGADGVNAGDVSTANPLPIGDAGGSLTVDGTVTATTTGLNALIGEVQASPTSNTVLDRLKALLTGISLAAGSAAIGKLAANSGVDIGDVDVASIAAGDNNIGNVDIVTVPADPFGANADAASATGSISAKLRFIASTGIPVTGTVTVGSHAVSNAGTFATQESGSLLTAAQLIDDMIFTDDAAFTPGTSKLAVIGAQADETATDSVDEGDAGALRMTLDRKLIVASAHKEDAASADADYLSVAGVKRAATPANTSGTDGDYEPLQGSGGYLWVHDNKGLSNLAFSAAFSTLTRPANTTAYAAADSISDNGTAGSVTALSATISDVNDDPIFISEILVHSTDTGLAGKKLRAYLFNSDPTANSGVSGGDNAAYSQKKAGYIGAFMGYMETGFSDGTVGRLVPSYNETNYSQAGGFVVTKPTSGARTLYIQYQAVEAFTPSANSTTIIGTARGWQGRAV
jgi:hypothetical protein